MFTKIYKKEEIFMEKKISVFNSGLIWFGAALSIAEILTGTYFAPLGFGKGLLAIIIGCFVVFFILSDSEFCKCKVSLEMWLMQIITRFRC